MSRPHSRWNGNTKTPHTATKTNKLGSAVLWLLAFQAISTISSVGFMSLNGIRLSHTDKDRMKFIPLMTTNGTIYYNVQISPSPTYAKNRTGLYVDYNLTATSSQTFLEELFFVYELSTCTKSPGTNCPVYKLFG